jgi:hypothetical protein
LRLTLVAFYSAPEDFVATLGANIAGFLILNPLFSTNLSPVRNGPQNDPLTYSHGKILNKLTRKFIALMTSGVTLLLGAGPDLTLPAMHKQIIG